MIKHIVAFVLLLIMVTVGMAQESGPTDVAQVLVSATPVRGVIATSTPQATSLALPTPLLTATPTDVGTIFLEAKPDGGTINVRLEPDPEAPRIGGINPGQTYEVTGRYFRWIQFRYTESQLGWVFDELVNIIGPAEFIPEIDPFSTAVQDPSIISASQTSEAITLTPGGILTATANSRFIEAPTSVLESSGSIETTQSARLPTFTPPPSVVAPPTNNGLAIAEGASNASAENSPLPNRIPPIGPIAILALIGFIGVILSAPRR